MSSSINVPHTDNNRYQGGPLLWLVGGEDVHMRIPLVNELKQRGFRVDVLGTQDPSRFNDTDINYYRYKMERRLSPFSDYSTVRELNGLVSDFRPDIVHAFDTKPGVLVPKAAQGICKIVRTITGMGYLFSSGGLFAQMAKPVYRIVQRRASDRADMTIFQNSDDMKYFQENGLVQPEQGILVRSSGINIREFADNKPDSKLLVQLREKYAGGNDILVTMITRLVRHKGVVEFLEAARMLHRKNLPIKFLLAGPIDSEGSQAIRQDEVDIYKDVVTYLGEISNVSEILAISDIFALPSYYREGVPRALLEAGLSGLPLITTDMPGCRDVVQNNWNGLIVPDRNAEALAEAIRELAGNYQKRHDMGVHSKQHVEESFSLESVADQYEAVYRALLTS